MYRPYVTCPDGTQAFLHANVKTEEDVQAVLAHVSAHTVQMLGMKPGTTKLDPQKLRELSSRVEFFKVAFG